MLVIATLGGKLGTDTIHQELSFQWARAVGFSETEARKIAEANFEADQGNGWQASDHVNRNPLLLFGGTSMWKQAQRCLASAVEGRDLALLGRGLHSLQDHYSHGWLPFYGRHWYSPWRLRGRRLSPFVDPDNLDHPSSAGRLQAAEEATKAYLRKYLVETVADSGIKEAYNPGYGPESLE